MIHPNLLVHNRKKEMGVQVYTTIPNIKLLWIWNFCGDDKSVGKYGWGIATIIINIFIIIVQMDAFQQNIWLYTNLLTVQCNIVPLTKCSGSLLNEGAN